MIPAKMDAQLYMDAVIRPHRSLTPRGFIILIAVLTTINCVTAAVFLFMGATPVPIFLGMDVLAVAVAFIASFRAAQRIERVQVSAAEVRVIRQWRDQAETVWISPTVYTQVSMVGREPEDEILKLRLSGRELAVAQALSPRERSEFAKALDRAIWRAKRES